MPPSELLSTLFWLATLAFITPFLLYPATLFLLSRLRPKRPPGKAMPSATLVISAFNEALHIQSKIENALALDYPSHLLQVMVISDASDDGTDELVLKFANRGVLCCRQSERLGKSAGLSRFCPQASGEILVFTDANSMFRPDALKNLVRHFDDPTVGYTVGRQLYDRHATEASADSENFYWNIELCLKDWESRLSSVVGADGAIYALRKELFEPLAAEDINDFLLPLKVIVKGFRGIFDPTAICFEDAAPDFQGEFRRKYRIVNRSLRAVTKVPQALNPFKVGGFAGLLFAHKVMRWFAPLFLVVMLVCSGGLAFAELIDRQPGGYSLLFSLQVAGYATAALYLLPPFRKIRLVYVAYYFLLVNVAAAYGIALLLSGRTVGVWKPQR
jgi:cellulose synthase/poly-beta-1,6-N-acetylglucosamine synthase-like glycosyltransferase